MMIGKIRFFLMVHKTVENNHFYCGLLLLMFMSIVTGYCSVRPEIPIYLGNIMKIYAIVSGMGFIISPGNGCFRYNYMCFRICQ